VAGTPAGFNADAVRAGLHTAMQFGTPADVGMRATFVTLVADTTAAPADDDGTPFDPAASITVGTPKSVQLLCAVEYVDALDKLTAFGYTTPARVHITLLDTEYSQIVGFDYVVVGGVRYDYRKLQPPLGMGPITVYVVECEAVDVS
jgi:hypothetical protein